MIRKSDLSIVSIIGSVMGFSLLAYAGAAQVTVLPSSGKYIIVLRDSATNSDFLISEVERKHGVTAELRYSKAIKGFSANLSSTKLAKMKLDPRVAFISEDRLITADGKPVGNVGQPNLPTQASPQATENRDLPKGNSSPVDTKIVPSERPSLPEQASSVASERVGGNGKANKGINQQIQPPQTVPTGINRIGSQNLANKGRGIGVAVIDSGIDLTHPDLVGNIAPVSKTCVSGTSSANDDNGHGTHVAGTIAATNNSIGVVGVAPEAKLYAVKVLDSTGSGSWSSVICGIDWITANAQALNIKVANMSLGGLGVSDNNCGITNNDALHRAICNSTAQGVTYVVSAGNSATSSTQSVPAAYDDTVITVSALADKDGISGGTASSTPYGADDTFASFSNYGNPVDIAAPGVSILSTWKGGAYGTISGTSMASPHVAGAVALFLYGTPSATWKDVRDALRFIGEQANSGHTDPSKLHPEPVLKASSL